MIKFIEIEDINGAKRMVNVNFITDIVGSRIFINCGASDEQPFINCKENYEQIKNMIMGCE